MKISVWVVLAIMVASCSAYGIPGGPARTVRVILLNDPGVGDAGSLGAPVQTIRVIRQQAHEAPVRTIRVIKQHVPSYGGGNGAEHARTIRVIHQQAGHYGGVGSPEPIRTIRVINQQASNNIGHGDAGGEIKTLNIIHQKAPEDEVKTINVIHQQPEEDDVKTIKVIHENGGPVGDDNAGGGVADGGYSDDALETFKSLKLIGALKRK